tara:strand:+ start:377 stop:1249 length:873 start_codon:yes stop_codon:yes gene_type:complete
MIDIGCKYGKLTITGKTPLKGEIVFEYVCDCGNIGVRRNNVLKRAILKGSSIDCGCSRKSISLGENFGRLTVVEKIPNYTQGGKTRGYWKLECKCGNFTESTSDLLWSGKKLSCGCVQKEHYKRGITQICYLWKTCPICEKELWHTEFGKTPERKGGLKALCRKCSYANKDKSKVATANFIRKKRIRDSVPNDLDRREIDVIHDVKYELKEMLGVELNVDHIYPLIHDDFFGLTIPINLQITTLKYNTGKGNRIESLDFDVLAEGSKFYKGVRIHKSVVELDPNIDYDPT